MKLIIDIADNKAESFMEMIKDHFYVKAKTLSAPDAELFEEIKEIKKRLEMRQKLRKEI